MPTNENGVANEVSKAITKNWPLAWQFKVVGSPYQMTGVPDFLVVVGGLLIGLELKFQKPGMSRRAARHQWTTGQRVQLLRINRAGGYGTVVLSGEEAVRHIRHALREKGITP